MADAAEAVKRFWTQVAVVASGDGFGIALDGRPVRTPARAPLVLPTRALADAVAAEWDGQGQEVDPRAMPSTGLANAAIDRVLPDPAGFAATLGDYAGSDVLCYRAEAPASLLEREAETWDPILAWARTRFDVAFRITSGIVHVAQPPATIERLRAALAAHDGYALAALSPIVTISGSLVISLALAEGRIDADTAFDASHLDELWQAERWGEDALAAAARSARRADFLAAARFLDLVAER